MLATIAYAGIEAASDLAPDLEFEPGDLKRVLSTGVVVVPLLYAGIAAIALMAVPVVAGPGGPETALAGDADRGAGAGGRSGLRPGLARGPDAVGGGRWSRCPCSSGPRTPRCSASRATSTSWPPTGRSRAGPESSSAPTRRRTSRSRSRRCSRSALALPGDIRFLAGVYAFGALLAITIAHVSIIRLRVTDPERERPFAVPLNLTVGGHRLPLPAIVGALITGLAWVSVLFLHADAVYVGGGWMVFGLVFYVVYRRLVEGTTLTKRVTVPEVSLKKQAGGGRVLVDPGSGVRDQAR